MSNLIRRNPTRDLMSMHDAMNRLFDEAFLFPREGMESPSIDVIENDDNITVKAELPGFKPEEIDVRVEGNVLTLRAEHNEEQTKGEGQYHVREIRRSSFTRSISLPSQVKTDQANADFENGILNLTLPKSEEQKPKRISISPKNK
jgi:HSP20 family protein